jgi:hypothetical protein
MLPRFPLFLAVAALAAVTVAKSQTTTTPPAPATTSATAAQSNPASTTSGEPKFMAGEKTPHYVKAETPEQRRDRVGAVDPGPDPDETTVFYRFSRPFHITKFEKKWAAFDQPLGFVRPFAYTPFVYELYQMNDEWVWVWVSNTPPEVALQEAAAAAPPSANATIDGYTPKQVEYMRYIQPEFSELTPTDSNTTVRFEESSEGLPTVGSWRNGAAIADMNGDGHLDIVTPPQRGPSSNGLPAIFLGDGKGKWRGWDTIFPYGVDYGGVAVADFNKDGHMDIACAVHLRGIRVFLGDGKGGFVDASKGLPNEEFSSRRVIIGDFDHDGYPDIAAISEGPAGRGGDKVAGGRIRIFLNRKKGTEWQSINVAKPDQMVGGDYLVAANLNGDKEPDFVAGSIYYQSPEILYLSSGKKLDWQTVFGDGKIVPFLGFYGAVAAGHFSSPKLDDALISFVRQWPGTATARVAPAPAVQTIVGIDRVTFAGKEPRRIPVIRFKGDRPISGMAVADFNGDGKMDVLFTRSNPREAVLLLGDGKGNFTRAKLEGLTLSDLTNYDLVSADLNGDGRPDVVLMYESNIEAPFQLPNGSIHVFLNRGVVKPAAAASKTKK